MTTILPDKGDMGLGWAHLNQPKRVHEPAIIRANRKALELLREAIDEALATRVGYCEVFDRDGEGYKVYVQRVDLLSGLGEPPYAKRGG